MAKRSPLLVTDPCLGPATGRRPGTLWAMGPSLDGRGYQLMRDSAREGASVIRFGVPASSDQRSRRHLGDEVVVSMSVRRLERSHCQSDGMSLDGGAIAVRGLTAHKRYSTRESKGGNTKTPRNRGATPGGQPQEAKDRGQEPDGESGRQPRRWPIASRPPAAAGSCRRNSSGP